MTNTSRRDAIRAAMNDPAYIAELKEAARIHASPHEVAKRTRAAAKKMGYKLVASPTKDSADFSFGRYRLEKLDTGAVVLGDAPFMYSATLADVEVYLKGSRM